MIRKITLLLVAVVVIGASAVPAAGAGTDGDAVAVAAAKKKCKKKPGAKKKKCKKKKAGGPSSPGLPGSPLSPTPQTPPSSPPPPPPPAEPTVANLTLDDDPVLGGAGTSGQVTISDPAPSGGKEVSLQSSSPTRVSVPSSVHVASGQTSASFAVSTTDGPTVTATITASIGTSSRNVQLTAVADPSVSSLTLAYKCFPGVGLVNIGGNRVTLDVPAPSDTPVDLDSDDPAIVVPDSVNVPDGGTSALFEVDTGPTANLAVTVTATLGTSSAQDTAQVRDGSSPAPAIDALALNPSTIGTGGTSTGTVTLGCEALAGGSVVTLVSSDPTIATVPVSVTVPEGSLTADFLATPALATAGGETTITATLGGFRQAVLTVTDNPI